MGAIFPPILFRQVGSIVGLTSLSLGARTVSTSSSPISAGLTVGSPLVVYDQSYHTQAEYLGKITALTSGTISFQFPSQMARGASQYVLGKPTAFWQAASTRGSGGITAIEDLGVETLDTTGAELIHTKVREARAYVELIIRDAYAFEWLAYRDFIKDTLAGGLSVFTAAYFDRESGKTRCHRVKFRNPGGGLQATAQASVLRTWPIDLQIIREDSL